MSEPPLKPAEDSLQYATPIKAVPWNVGSLNGGALGILLGLFGAYALFACVQITMGMIQETRQYHWTDPNSVHQVTFTGLIGLFCVTVATRWVRQIFRKRRADLESAREG